MHRPISFFQPSGARHDIRGQDSFSYPTVARSALGLGLQALLGGVPLGPAPVPQPAFFPTQPSWAWNAGQPSPDPASLMPLPNTRPLIRLFQRADVPKQSSKPAIRKAAKGLTLGCGLFSEKDKLGVD